MKEEIVNYLNNPRQLEKMYRTNKGLFKREFSTIYPELKGNTIADTWNERLNYETDEISWGSGRELFLVIIAALVAGLIAKLPEFIRLDEEFFYSRNIGFIIFPVLSAYFAWKNKLSTSKILIIAGITLSAFVQA